MPPGPYRLHLCIRERRLVFDISDEQDNEIGAFHLSLSPFKQVVKDYWQICESYFDAVKKLPPSQIPRIMFDELMPETHEPKKPIIREGGGGGGGSG